MHPLILTLLGSFHAQQGEQTLSGFRTKATQALLTYLATSPDIAHNRDQLITLLWPGMPLKSGRANLRQTLYQLRQDIPEVKAREGDTAVDPAIANRQDIQLNPAADVQTDVIRFETLLDQTGNHDHPDLLICPDCRQNFEEAVTLYRGHFLYDFYLEDSSNFEEWAQGRRDYYRRRALDALAILTTMAIRRKDYPQAQQTAEHQLQIDNLNENAYRQLMEIHALNGRREQALATYKKCRRVLAEELGMAPTARTTELYQKILAGDLEFQAAPVYDVRGYELKELLAEGGHGAVHRAIQPVVNREVAVKVIRRQHADDPDFIRRFEAEAQIVARLEHPHIVPLYDYWRDPNGAYLVLRYMRHGSLLTALQSGPWEPDQAANLLNQIAGALSTAHQKGIVHRDLKPGNILLDDDGNAYLTDFGIAKDLLSQEQITSEKAVVGTLDYTSPEQILSGEVTPQSDIYSLGAVIYETLTGEKPFADDSIARVLHNQLNNPMPLVTATRPDIPAGIDVVLQKATAKKAAERYATAQEMAEAFFAAIGSPAIEGGYETAERLIPEVAEIYNPYKGLRAFQEADADDFFGRDALVQQLVDRLGESASRFLAIVGPSGSGKSSAVKAGLIPALRAGALSGSENWFTAEMVPGTYPLEELELALWPVAVDPPPSLVQPMERDTRGMLRTIRRILPNEDGFQPQLLLIIDQFEELFTLVEDQERREFFLDSLLTAMTAPRSPLRVVITLRADFYDRPLLHQEWGQIIKDNTEIVLPLNHSELTWAIREPARRMGVRLEDDLIPTIVADVADQLGALPLFQYALTELFERRDDNLITHDAYQAIGGVQGALGRRAEAIYKSLDENGREATRQLYLRLVTLGEGSEDTRRRVLRIELEKLNIHNSQFIINYSLLEFVLDRFGSARLLTFDRDPTSRTPTVEVAHEALLREWPRLRRWLQQSRDDVRLQRLLGQSAAEWMNANKDDAYLLRGSRLDQFGAWSEETQLGLTQDEKSYLAASLTARTTRQEAEEARRQRELEAARQLAESEKVRADEQAHAAGRLRQRAVWLAGALVIAAVLALAAFFLAQQSNQNAQTAQQNADAAATSEAQALANADLAAANEAEAIMNLELATTREADAIAAEINAVNAQATAQAEAVARGEAEAVAIEERELAEEQAQIAISRELAAAALNNLDKDPELSILLAMEGLSTWNTFEAEGALHQALQSSPLRGALYHGRPSIWAAFNHERTQLFVSGAGGGNLWNLETGELLYTKVVTGFDWINLGGFSPDGSLLVMPGENNDENYDPLTSTITILDTSTFEELVEFPAHGAWIQSATFSPDGALFATISYDRSVKVWDLNGTLSDGTGQLVHNFCCFEDWGSYTAFSPDGERLFASLADAGLKIFDMASGQELATLDTRPNKIIFSPDGRYIVNSTLASSDYRGRIEVWDAATYERLSTTIAHEGNSILGITFSPDGSQLVSYTNDDVVTLWQFSPDELQLIMELPGTGAGSGGVSFSPDGRFLTVSGRDGVTRVLDISPTGRSEVGLISGPIEGERFVQSVDFFPGRSKIVTSGSDGSLRVWDTTTWEEELIVPGSDAAISQIAVSPDGRFVATAIGSGGQSIAQIWDAETWQQLYTLEGHPWQEAGFFRGVRDVEFSPDNQWLATAGGDDRAIIWDVSTGTQLVTMTGHTGDIVDLNISPDGTFLATASRDGTARIWDIQTGQTLITLTTTAEYWAVNFSPDGSQLLAGRTDGVAEIWNLPDDPYAFEEPTLALEIQTSATWISPGAASYSPDGKLIVTTGTSGAVEIFDAETGQLLLQLLQSGSVNSVEFSLNGDHLFTIGQGDGILRVYTLNLDELIALAQSRVTRSLTEAECQQYLHLDACPAEP